MLLVEGLEHPNQFLEIAALVIPSVAMAVSVVTDIAKGRIVNAVTFPAIIAGLLVSFLRHGLKGLISPAAIILFLFVFGMFGLMGLGDVKLVMSVGAALGWLPACICLGGGALLSLLYWVVTTPREAANGFKNVISAISVKSPGLAKNGRKIPFAPFLAVSFTAVIVLCACGVLYY